MVAIIIPIYKSRDTLPTALDSLVSQTKKTFMVIPSIDGDGENYDDLFEEYEKRGLHIYPIYSKENCGPGIARQRGIDAAKMCKYLMFLDADDMLLPRAVEVLTHEIEVKNADIVAGTFLSEQSPGIAEIYDAHEKGITWLHGKIYRREYLVENNIRFLSEFKFNEDAYFNLVAWNCSNKTYKIKESLYLWRNNQKSLTRSVTGKELQERIIGTYVQTQILALQKIIEIKNDINTYTFAATLYNIYSHIMRSNFYKIENKDYLPYFNLIKNNDVLQSKFGDAQLWQYLITHALQGSTAENSFFFYKQNILDWLNEFIINKEKQ